MEYTRADLEKYVCEVFNIKEITPMLIRHITYLSLDKDMSFKEIARCLCWYTEVAGKQVSILYGIKNLENFRVQANEYFKKLELDQQRKIADAKRAVEYQDNNIIIHLKNFKYKKKMPKLIDISQIDVKGEEDGDNN